ncbi:MAG TPA: hypothetical protein PLK44_15195 [Aestuariivirga sp.]|nr:hypothetical protein [Aestuariivirga sp.]
MLRQQSCGTWRDVGTELIVKPGSRALSIMCVAALGLAGCATGPKGVRFIDGAGGAGSKPVAQPIQQFSAGEIQTAIVGKTFQYTRSDGNGFVTYNADGTFNYQDDNKGEGTGKWETSNSLFCEIFGPNAIQECGEFKSTGDAYFAAKSRLVEMKS